MGILENEHVLTNSNLVALVFGIASVVGACTAAAFWFGGWHTEVNQYQAKFDDQEKALNTIVRELRKVQAEVVVLKNRKIQIAKGEKGEKGEKGNPGRGIDEEEIRQSRFFRESISYRLQTLEKKVDIIQGTQPINTQFKDTRIAHVPIGRFNQITNEFIVNFIPEKGGRWTKSWHEVPVFGTFKTTRNLIARASKVPNNENFSVIKAVAEIGCESLIKLQGKPYLASFYSESEQFVYAKVKILIREDFKENCYGK